MPANALTDAQCHQAAEAYRRRGTLGAELLGLNSKTFVSRVRAAIERGLLDRSERNSLPPDTPMPHIPGLAPQVRRAPRAWGTAEAGPADDAPTEQDPAAMVDTDQLRRLLAQRCTLDDIARRFDCTRGLALDAVEALREAGYSVHHHGGAYWLDTRPQTAIEAGRVHEYRSRPDGSYIFGFTSDNHIGSKYSRLDVLARLFERFAEVGVDRVFNAGNWIDGEASFNRHDLEVHGMDAQCAELARVWPQVGLTTYAVTGDDHEGWYAQREGVDIGRYAQQCFAAAGRSDWVDLGHIEADIRLVHAATGAATRLRVAHPGGGSAYATSYAPQKYIESLDGGDKPAVVLLGHWHKIELLNIRNVWVIQTGCTQDQTPFGRKRRLDFHVGGGLCRLQQDPTTGAITSCTVEFLRYFNREYYGTGRWSHHGPVKMPERDQAPV